MRGYGFQLIDLFMLTVKELIVSYLYTYTFIISYCDLFIVFYNVIEMCEERKEVLKQLLHPCPAEAVQEEAYVEPLGRVLSLSCWQ